MRRLLNPWCFWQDKICGAVHGHPRYDDGEWIYTSPLLELDMAALTARTKESLYSLGPDEITPEAIHNFQLVPH